MSDQDNLQILTDTALSAIKSAESIKTLDDIRVEYLGKKGSITEQLKALGKLPKEERSAAMWKAVEPKLQRSYLISNCAPW